MAIPVVEGYTVTRWDQYCAGRSDLLIDNAAGRLVGPAVLDAFDPDWRARWWTTFEVFQAEDENPSIRGKKLRDGPRGDRMTFPNIIATDETADLRDAEELRAWRDGVGRLAEDPMHAGQPVPVAYRFDDGEPVQHL